MGESPAGASRGTTVRARQGTILRFPKAITARQLQALVRRHALKDPAANRVPPPHPEANRHWPAHRSEQVLRGCGDSSWRSGRRPRIRQSRQRTRHGDPAKSHCSLVSARTAAATPRTPPTTAPPNSPSFPAALPTTEPITAPRPANAQVAMNTGMGFRRGSPAAEGRVFA